MAYVIAEPCVNVIDRACVEVCPVQCFYEAGDQLVIHPQECVDCDACKPVCPTAAIFPLAEVPAEWQSFIQKNADWFAANPTPIKAMTREEAEVTGLPSTEVSKKALAGEAAVAVAEAPKPAAHDAAKPAVAAPKPAPKPAPPKPEAPAFPNAENYARAKVLLSQLIEAQARHGELTPAQVQSAVAMVADLRKEIAAAFGKTEITLGELEKKAITWRQHEELARSLLRCAETLGPKQIKRGIRRKFVEYAVGTACTGLLTLGALWLALESAQDWTFRLTGWQSLGAPLQSEGFAVALAFGAMAGILGPFAVFAFVRLLQLGRQMAALGGFDRAAWLRTLEMKAAGKGGRRQAA